MAIEIKAPTFPESVADGTVATWHKKPGEAVKRDELIVDIETDKVVIEVLAEADGVLAEIIKNEGDTVLSNELLGKLNEGGAALRPLRLPLRPPPLAAQAAAPAAAGGDDAILSPAARKLAEEAGIDPNSIAGTGKGGRVTKEDVVAAVEAKKNAPAAPAKPAAPAAEAPIFAAGDRVEARADDPPAGQGRRAPGRGAVRHGHADHLQRGQHEADHGPAFEVQGPVREEAQRRAPGLHVLLRQGRHRGAEALPGGQRFHRRQRHRHHGYQDIGVAVSATAAVVPVLRNAEFMSLAEIEGGIANFGKKAKEGKLTIEDMTGGTFTISNGGVFGSLSTRSSTRRRPPSSACTRSRSARWP